MRPYADNVVIELEPEESVSAGGIHLVNTCGMCGGHGWVNAQGNKNRCKPCGGTGVSGGKQARGHRYARVIASGPGYYAQTRGECGSTVEQPRRFIPNETKPGDRVLVDALAGNVWDAELSVPRHNPGLTYGETRIVREQEILAIVEPCPDPISAD